MIGPADYWRIFKNRGIRQLFDELIENLAFDLRYGIDTQERVYTGPYIGNGVEETPYHNYVPSYSRPVKKALDLLRPWIGDNADWHFYDIGCGKGKTLVLAHETRLFSRIVGVENDPYIAARATANIEKIGLRELVEVQVCDGREALPPENARVVLFMYNPFSIEITHDVLRNFERRVSECYLIYFGDGDMDIDWQRIATDGWRNDRTRVIEVFHFRRPSSEPTESTVQ